MSPLQRASDHVAAAAWVRRRILEALAGDPDVHETLRAPGTAVAGLLREALLEAERELSAAKVERAKVGVMP